MSQEPDLHGELMRLRRGRGIERPGLGAHLGPGLRALCGVAVSDRDAHVRPRVTTVLAGLIDGLPPDLREVAQVAFALDKEYRFRTLEERIRALAERRPYAERTIRRMMDRAARMMVEEVEAAAGAGAPEAAAGPGWRMRSLAALFRLDTTTPELYETRKIIASRDVDQLTVRLGLPAAADRDPTDGLVVDALFGARVATVEPAPHSNHFRIVLDLPRVSAGDEHEFWLRVVLPAGQPIWPHYAIVPLNACDYGTVRVRFATDRPPATVWVLDEVPYLDLADETPGAERIRPDGNGDVVRHFTGLREGYGYGVAWRPTT